MNTLIEQFSSYLTVERGFSPWTVKAYKHDLNKFVSFLDSLGKQDLKQVTKNDVRQFVTSLAETNAAITRARKLSSIKSFYKYLTKENIVASNPAIDIEAPKIPEKEPCYLTQDEYQALLKAVERKATIYYKPRDLAIVTLLLGTGIRLSELVGLTLNSIKLNNGESSVKVRGKGDKERSIPLNGEVVAVLDKYLKSRPDVQTEQLFVSRLAKGLSSGAVYHLVKRYFGYAGIQKEKFGVHSLRHTFATSLLNNKNVNIVHIQQLLGHKKIETTRRYLHINDLDLRNAVNSLVLSKK